MITVLCGFKGCGKSVIGRAIALKKEVDFVDLDALIEQQFCSGKPKKLSFREIFKLIGPLPFRQLEKATLAQFMPEGDLVFSVGGGTLMDSENVNKLRDIGRLVYLSVADDLLFERIMADGIPATFDESDPRGSFESLKKQRYTVYEKACDVKIDVTDYTIDQAAMAVIGILDGV